MEQLKVIVRIRPFLPHENSAKTGIEIDSENSQKIEISKSLKKFSATFDRVLSQNCTQKEVFNFIKPCLKYVKKGINCTILAYGQTGSGKTYTMFGGEWAMNDKSTDYEIRKKFNKDKYNFILNDELTIDPFSETNGIIPNLIMNLFQVYGTYDASENNIIITCSYIQIYNEQVYDLLIDEKEMLDEKKAFNLVTGVGKNINEKPIKQKPLKIKYDRKNGVTIDGVNEVRTPTFYDIFEILRQGEINRKIRQTHKNEMSSRSHTIFIINLQDIKNKVCSKIKLCDLAGSERYDSRESYKKLHFSEMCNINKSLLVLGNVIHFLGQNNSFINMPKNKNDKNVKNQKTFVPYKDSKLTQILEDSLGGNSITYLIANISPSEESFEETLSTLQFADRAHSIMTQVSMNQLNDKTSGINPKEFNKICDELSQLKQLLYIRKKRGTLEPIQEELLKLKDENSQLKKYLGGENNVNRIQELMLENKNLRKEIKNLKDLNENLKNEINSKPLSHLSSELNNDNNNNNKNVFSEKKIYKINNNDFSSNNDINNNYNKLKNNLNNNNDIYTKNDINDNYNNLKNNISKNNNNNDNNYIMNNYNNLKNDLNNNKDIYSNNDDIKNNYNNLKNNLNSDDNKTGKNKNINSNNDDNDNDNDNDYYDENHLYNLNDYITSKKYTNNNNENNYNKYDIDDLLDDNEKNNTNDNNNEYNLNKNSKKSTKKNVFLESGQNIIYGSKGKDKNEKEKNAGGGEEDIYDELNDLNYDDFDFDINESNINNYSKNNKSKANTNKSKTNTNKAKNSKLSKLNNAASPFERLQLLEQLEMENKKKTQELIDNITKNNKIDDED